MSAQQPFSKLTTNTLETIYLYKAGGLFIAITKDKKFVYRHRDNLILAIIDFYEEKEWDRLDKEAALKNVKPLQLQETNL